MDGDSSFSVERALWHKCECDALLSDCTADALLYKKGLTRRGVQYVRRQQLRVPDAPEQRMLPLL